MNFDAAWARAREKYFKLVGTPALLAALGHYVDVPPTRRPEMRGPAYVIASRPVREMNGAELGDQRVRWVPERAHERVIGFDKAKTDSRTGYMSDDNFRQVLRMALAAQPEGSAERARLEKLLHKLESKGG